MASKQEFMKRNSRSMKNNVFVVAGIAVATVLSPFASSTPGRAEEPLIRGSVVTPTGVPMRSYPVAIEGKTARGERFNSYVTTDQKGLFEVYQLPPGTYTAIPAGEPDSGNKEVTIKRKPFFNFWKSDKTQDLGKLIVKPGSKLRPLD